MSVRRRRLLGLAILLVLIALVACASLAIGAQPTSVSEIAHALFSPTGTTADAIVRDLRVPRTLLGLVVGAALGMAGALIQGHTRNPLADPGLLGLNAGAAFLVVVGIYFFGLNSPQDYVWLALLGSLLAGVLVFGVASIGGGTANPLGLVLAGAAATFFLQAMTNALVVRDARTLDSFRFWVVGAIAGRDMNVFWQTAPFLVIGMLLAVVHSPALNVLDLGDDVARALGTNLAINRAIGLAAVTLMCGAATAACGPIAFLGLLVPHVARSITGPDYRWLVPYSGLIGAIVLVVADVIGRVVVRPAELYVGIVLALVGGPFFIALVRRRRLVAP